MRRPVARWSARLGACVLGGVSLLSACGDEFTSAPPDPTTCTTDDDCTSQNQTICNTNTSACVECVSADDCSSGRACEAGECVTSEGCRSSLDCSDDEVCDSDNAKCVECLKDEDCLGGQSCQATLCRTACTADDSCPSGAHCDSGLGVCVDCVQDVDCPSTRYCDVGRCVPDICLSGVTTCANQTVVECDVEGRRYMPLQACNARQSCIESVSSASCEDWLCTAGATECESTTVVIECSADGLVSTKLADCAATQQFCNGGHCSDLACAPESVFCEAGKSISCSADGLSRTSTSCKPTEYCNEQTGACTTQVCAPNAPVCDQDLATTCNAEGSGYTGTGVVCAAGGCSAGACNSVIFSDDFEDQSFVDWPKTSDYALTGSVSSAAAANGSGYGLSLSGGGAPYTGIYKDFGPGQPSYVSFWTRTDTAGVSSGHFFLMSDNFWVTYFNYTTSNNLGVANGNGGASLGQYLPNQWYHIEIHLDWGNKTADFTVNGVEQAAGLALRPVDFTSLSRLHLYNADAATVYWDEIEIR